MKQIKMFLTVFFVLGFMTATVSAGTMGVNNGTAADAIKIAREVLGVSRNVTASGTTASTTTAGVAYLLGGSVPLGGQVRFQVSPGISFNTQLINLCLASSTSTDPANSTSVDSITPSTGALNVTFNSAGVIPSGRLLYLSNNACTVAPATSFTVPANAAVAMYAINAAIVGSGLDTGAAVNLVNVAQQTTTTLASSKLIGIDYLAETSGNPKDGTHFVLSPPGTNLIAGASNKFTASSTAASSFTVPMSTYSVNYTTAINLTDTAAWQGVTRVYASTDNATCSHAFNSASSNNTALVGTVSLNRTSYINGSGVGNDYSDALCILASGNVTLNRRTISASVFFTASSGGLAPSNILNQPVMMWQPNGYQAFNPYMYVGADHTVDVFNRFYNNSTDNAQVFVEVFPADGSAAQTFTLASIPANSAGLYWASDIGALASLPVGTSYAARFTITANPASVNGVSFFKRTEGERQLALYKNVNSLDTYLSE
ncbi:MAG: hypothetical protein HY881_12100 [Deltaproteobacteria bacterium]|nr:hypothetical protein [Deltaproteobacteria bacterium]